MPTLIGVSGLCGSGKSTAIQFLTSICPAIRVYVGGIVLEELERRQLERDPESECKIQSALREEHGQDALAVMAASQVAKHLSEGHHVLVDAIFNLSEFNLYKEKCLPCDTVTLAIHASFYLRCERLAARPERRLVPDDIRKRDWNEVMNLGAGTAITLAQHHISNNGSLQELQQNLIAFWNTVRTLADLRRV
jgi:dephospho-CoA kinase